MPNDISPEVVKQNNIYYININTLQKTANQNLALREKETIKAQRIINKNLKKFKQALVQRKVELLMKNVPVNIKEIRAEATHRVFADKLKSLDNNSKALIDSILNYIEKIYIGILMRMAKEVLIGNTY